MQALAAETQRELLVDGAARRAGGGGRRPHVGQRTHPEYAKLSKCNTKNPNSSMSKWTTDMKRHFADEDTDSNTHEKMCDISSHQGNAK